MQPNSASNETPLPRAIRRQMKELEDKRKKSQEPIDPSATPVAPEPPADPTAAAVPAPPADTPAAPRPPQPTITLRDLQESDPDYWTELFGDARAENPAYWAQRFRASQGLLRGLNATHATEKQALQQRVTELEGQVTDLQARPVAPKKTDLSRYFTAEQIERFGEEQCLSVAHAAETAAEETAQRLIDARMPPHEPPAPAPTADPRRETRQAFVSKLTELWPDWQADDKDARWLAWLAEDGGARQGDLDGHMAAGAAGAGPAARMFWQWRQLVDKPAAAPPAPPVAPRGGAAPAGNDTPPASAAEVSALVAPTGPEVREFYKRAALGKVKDDERVKFEARLKLRNPGR